MKKIILFTLFALSIAISAQASPFLVCDPYTGATYFKVLGLPGSPIVVQPDPTKTYGFKYDLVSLPVGSYTATAVACIVDPSPGFGEVCSDSSLPLSLTRPGPGPKPLNLKLVP